ncbi:hypothetical protein T492DRAFT_832155 [Pavlovales sp. CCMP2436]|nr:hypothetical protein T492DRAFT_832155 [Pavlovales sp. CCMP2436]|mmetsp:Transcript_32698/g.81316  ORF Transcript_32698/g.81316 Transcript_32698/m.81316 type:complete len:237 (-) Transcript_32698:89-799(-)
MSNGEMRATYVDADEARMMRAMRRYRGDDEARQVGNDYSQANAVRLTALAERNALRPQPQPAQPAPPARRGLEPKASKRAVAVPRVGRGPPARQYAPIELTAARKKLPEVQTAAGASRPDYSAYEPAPLAPYHAPLKSREEQKERLQDRIAFGEDGTPDPAPQRLATQPGEPPSEATQLATLATAISREIDERRQFLGEMNALGKGAPLEAQIRGEIAERQQELKRLGQLMAALGT